MNEGWQSMDEACVLCECPIVWDDDLDKWLHRDHPSGLSFDHEAEGPTDDEPVSMEAIHAYALGYFDGKRGRQYGESLVANFDLGDESDRAVTDELAAVVSRALRPAPGSTPVHTLENS